VRLEYTRALQVGEQTVNLPATLTVPVEVDGTFTLTVDSTVLEDPNARLEVRSPIGRRLTGAVLREILEQDRLRTLTVQPEVPLDLRPSPATTQPRLLIARVLDRDGRRDVAHRQVTIVAVPGDATSNNPQPALVFAGRTDAKGYVSGPYPTGRFGEAIADIEGARAEVHLEEDGSFPPRVIVAIALPEADTPAGPAPPGASPPRAPEEEDLLNSPESFSNDLGVGRCIDFTVPNRTLEEVPFYKIVRTTDPEIKGTNLEPPLELPPGFNDWIKQVGFGLNTIDSKLKVRPAPETAIGLTTVGEQPLPASDQPRLSTSASSAAARERAAFSSATTPPLISLETAGVRAVAQWRTALDPASVDTALTQAVPTLSVESLRSVLVDPDEFTPLSLMTAERLSAHQLMKDVLRAQRGQAPGRAPLDELNAVDWDETPTFYQATTIAHGHLLQFRQVWKADGYSLGDLLHSIPLAPCQKKQIVTVDWDRREDATRTEELTEQEILFADLVRDRDVKELIDSALSESIEGGSTARTYGGGGGLGFAIGPLVIGAAGGAGGASSEAWQDASRQVAAQSVQDLQDRINQSAAAVRSQRATVVQTVAQGERTRVQTEVIANHNHCHALTIQFFEVLRHFQVSEELAEVRECLFVPFLMSQFHDAKVLRWREALARSCLRGDLRDAFDAIERIQLNYVGVDFPLGSFAEEPLQSLDGELRVRLTIARPRDPKEDEPDYFETVWPFWPRLIGGNPADIYDRHLRNQQFKDVIFRDQFAPQIAERFVQSLRLVLIDENGAESEAHLDPTLASKYHEGTVHTITLADSGNTPPVARKSIVAIEIRTDHELPEHSQVIIEGATFRYRTRHLSHDLYNNPRVLDDLLLGDPVFLSTATLSREETRNPRAEDLELRRRLLIHLNANLEYYHKAMWWAMDKERRFILLDGFIAPHSGGRSVASVVENNLLGIIGNALVFPVVAGFQLDPRYRAIRDQEGPERPTPTLFDLYAPVIPNPPRHLSIPTKGVFAEAVMGACNSCEIIDESRFWRWSESPCPDEPPRIAEVSAASRAGETPDLTPQDFPAPIVSFQNIPQAPDPAGLRAALELIGRGDLFRDVTGLTQNQRNALGALQASLTTAQAFGQEAIQLAHAKAAQRTIDQTLKAAEQAKQEGHLTEEAARQITRGALQALIGQQGAQDTSLLNSQGLQQALNAAAASPNSTVRVTDEAAGQQQTVEVTKEGPGAEGQAAPRPVGFHDSFEDGRDLFIDLPVSIDGPDGANWRVSVETLLEADLFDLYMGSLADLQNAAGEVVGKLHWQAIGFDGGFLRVHPTIAGQFQARADLRIFYPAAPGNTDQLAPSQTPYPIVLIVHGNHNGWDADMATLRPVAPPRTVVITKPDGSTTTVPVMTADASGQTLNHQGYEELQRELARHGIVSISVSTNFANSLDSKVRMRADTALRCLDRLRAAATNTRTSRFFGRLDFSNVGVMGHSRGGDAVLDVFALNRTRINQAPDTAYGIRAVCLLASTDQTGAVTGTGKLALTSGDDATLFVLYGSQDGDVYTGAPFKHYDRSNCPKSLVFVRGANHNRFNSNWGLNDPRLSPSTPATKILAADVHTNLANEFIGGFFRWKLNREDAIRGRFNGSQANTAGTGGATVEVAIQWRFGDPILLVDDFETDGPLNNRTGGRHPTNGTIESLVNTAGLDAFRKPHETRAMRFTLTPAGTFSLREQLTFLDFFSDFDVLTFRMQRDYTSIGSDGALLGAPSPTLTITLREAGREADVSNIYAFTRFFVPDLQLLRFPNETSDKNVTKLVMQTYSIPISAFLNLNTGPIDLNAIPEIEFSLNPALPMVVSIDSVLLVKR
jgi:hypothetical protein